MTAYIILELKKKQTDDNEIIVTAYRNKLFEMPQEG